MDQRILFARIGWMTFYRGAKEERPLGGGSYTKENIGSELFNFTEADGFLYGFARAGAHGHRAVNLKRVDPTRANEGFVEGVTAIFVAKDPAGGGQRIVGWYKQAVVYATYEPHPLKAPYKKGIVYCIKAEASKACLLPTPWRRQEEQPEVRRGAGGMGESNVCYARSPDGRPRVYPWMKRVLRYIEAYEGPNLLSKDDEIEEVDQSEALQKVIEESAGFETNPKIRLAIEKHAMWRATKYFQKQGFSVKSKGKPYDLYCTKGNEVRYVEVKGTRSKGESVALTKNEVEFLGKHATASTLFILHSVEVESGQRPKASGGKIRIVEPWDQSKGVLRPINFLFRLEGAS